MSDVSQGEGWWVASDGKWYAPPSTTPPLLEPMSEIRKSDGSWQAKDGRWYPANLYPETGQRLSAPVSNEPAPGWGAIATGQHVVPPAKQPETEEYYGIGPAPYKGLSIGPEVEVQSGSPGANIGYWQDIAIGIGIVVLVAGLIFGIVALAHSSGPSQSYKDGWNTALTSTNVDCNNDVAPNGDDQTQWMQGCNDGSNAANNALSGGNTPTTFP